MEVKAFQERIVKLVRVHTKKSFSKLKKVITGGLNSTQPQLISVELQYWVTAENDH